jgi:hypothetical protein
MKKTLLWGLAGLVAAAFLRQRRRPIPHPPRLTFLFENPLVGVFVGPGRLIEHLELAPGMRVFDAGCGPGRLTIPLARAVGPDGEVVALEASSPSRRSSATRTTGGPPPSAARPRALNS